MICISSHVAYIERGIKIQFFWFKNQEGRKAVQNKLVLCSFVAKQNAPASVRATTGVLHALGVNAKLFASSQAYHMPQSAWTHLEAVIQHFKKLLVFSNHDEEIYIKLCLSFFRKMYT